MRNSRQRHNRGFTLIELLVVIAIIAILVALLLPAVQQAREAARRTECTNNLKQLALALHNYHDVHKLLPSGWIGVENGAQSAHEGANGAGWGTMILPMMDQGPLYEKFNPNVPIHHPLNLEFLSHSLKLFECPSDPKDLFWQIEEEGAPGTVLALLPTANYIGVFGPDELDGCENAPGNYPVRANGQCVGQGPLYHNSRVRLTDIKDGTSNTFLVGERKTDSELGWYSTWPGMVAEGEEAFQRILGSADHVPNDPAAHFDDFSSHHIGGAQFAMCDGAVRFVGESIDGGVYQAISTTRGGETVEEF